MVFATERDIYKNEFLLARERESQRTKQKSKTTGQGERRASVDVIKVFVVKHV